MSKEEILVKIKKIVETGKYDVEELLTVIPTELLPEVLNIIQNQTKSESEEIKLDLANRHR